jgi:hypothetical protein
MRAVSALDYSAVKELAPHFFFTAQMNNSIREKLLFFHCTRSSPSPLTIKSGDAHAEDEMKYAFACILNQFASTSLFAWRHVCAPNVFFIHMCVRIK